MIEYLLKNAAIFKYIWIDVDIASTNFKTNSEIAQLQRNIPFNIQVLLISTTHLFYSVCDMSQFFTSIFLILVTHVAYNPQ